MDLKEYLIVSRQNIYQFAAISDVSHTTLCRMLRGKKVSMRMAIKIEEGSDGAIKAQEVMKDGVR